MFGAQVGKYESVGIVKKEHKEAKAKAGEGEGEGGEVGAKKMIKEEKREKEDVEDGSDAKRLRLDETVKKEGVCDAEAVAVAGSGVCGGGEEEGDVDEETSVRSC